MVQVRAEGLKVLGAAHPERKRKGCVGERIGKKRKDEKGFSYRMITKC